MKKLIPAVTLALLLCGCTWVKLTEAGRDVRLLEATEVTGCESAGRITAVSRAKVAGVERNTQKLALELSTIARNEAASMGGNAVAAMGPIEGNERRFGVYRCQAE